MNEYYLLLVIRLAVSVVLAVILGNGAVYWFNHMPVRWFEDDGLPDNIEDSQRIRSTPWKYIFVAYFAACGIYLALRENLQYEVAVMAVLFIVLEMAVSDSKYRIVPDQLNILLAISAVGFIGFYDEWWYMLAGAGAGFAIGIAVYGLGRLIYKTDTIGGADIKFYAAAGLITGVRGVLAIFIMTTLVTAVHVLFLAVTKRITGRESRPMLPYAFLSVTVYMLFLWSALETIEL